jgi:hypothetical protein
VWIPLDVLKYITQFLYLDLDRWYFMQTCHAFRRAILGAPPVPRFRFEPIYGSAERGLVRTVDMFKCHGPLLVADVSKHGALRIRLKSGEDFFLQMSHIHPDGHLSYRTYLTTTWRETLYEPGMWCPLTGRLSRARVLLDDNRAEIIREADWMYSYATRLFPKVYERVNAEKHVKHKRPRKRVKRFGFDV